MWEIRFFETIFVKFLPWRDVRVPCISALGVSAHQKPYAYATEGWCQEDQSVSLFSPDRSLQLENKDTVWLVKFRNLETNKAKARNKAQPIKIILLID